MEFASYISGFVDGEGTFSVSFSFNSRLKTCVEVRPSFSISQHKRSKKIFIDICNMMLKGLHLDSNYLFEIIEKAYLMNESGKRKYSKEKLLSLVIRWRYSLIYPWKWVTIKWSSDTYERFNDRVTVLNIYPVKLKERWRCRLITTGQKDPMKLYWIFTLIRIWWLFSVGGSLRATMKHLPLSFLNLTYSNES